MKRIIIPFDAHEVKLTSPYGSRTLNGKANFHAGYDLVGIGSRTVVAAVGGTVVVSRIIADKSNRTWEWGNYICVRGDDGRQYYYCHLASRAVAKGARINAGDKLGVMGSTGYAFGAHLHFEVREADGRTTVNPEAVLGIPNREGVYTAEKPSLDADLAKLVAAKIITSPAYWKKTAPTVRYLPELLHNMAEAL